MIIKKTSKDIYMIAILVLVFGIVYFYSLINYNIRIWILLVAIIMEIAMPLLFKDYTVSITSGKILWAVALCIALIEKTRCIDNETHGTLYFILVII